MAKLLDTSLTHRFALEAYRITIGKTGHFIDASPARLSPEVLEYLFTYGLKQCLNDAAASGKTDDEKVGLSNKRWESLLEGKLRAQRAEANPVSKELRRLATDLVKRKAPGLKDEALRAAVAKAMGVEALLTLAQQNVKRDASLDLDISFD